MTIRHIINQSFSGGYGTMGRDGDDRRKIPIPIGDECSCTQT